MQLRSIKIGLTLRRNFQLVIFLIIFYLLRKPSDKFGSDTLRPVSTLTADNFQKLVFSKDNLYLLSGMKRVSYPSCCGARGVGHINRYRYLPSFLVQAFFKC